MKFSPVFNPFRQLFKHEANSPVIKVQNVRNPQMEYGQVWLDDKFVARSKVESAQVDPMMTEVMVELRGELQRYADLWRYLTINATPEKLVAGFVKQQAFSRSPKNR